MYSKIKIFCDFDGTIAKIDLGDEIFKLFGQFEPFHSQLLAGDINIFQYWHSVVKTLDINIEPEIEKLANNTEIDNYFIDFLNMCKLNNYQISVVSDGFSSYIYPIMSKFNFDLSNVYCNKINFSGVTPYPEFYGATESCDCLSASCKKNIILNNIKDDEISVFVGDGYSDYCAAEHSDIIFAKKNLAKYCSENKLPFFNYKTFLDIIRIFDNIHSGKLKLRKRRQAQLKVQKAFEKE